MTKRARRLTRDTVILVVAILWGTFEIIGFGPVGGQARSEVLVLVGSVLLSPAVMRIDEAIREKRRGRVD